MIEIYRITSRIAITGCLLSILLTGCISSDSESEKQEFWVKSVGDRQAIIQEGKLDGRIQLSDLKSIPNLYALGPVEGLQGEVTIYDSLPSISTIKDDAPVVDETFEKKAIFLLYASVPEWQAAPVTRSLNNLQDIEQYVAEQATTHGLDTSAPFPFRLEGVADTMTYHIIFKDNAAPHNKHQHHKSKVKFPLTNQAVNILGFWVDEARVGKLTHPGKRTHLHMVLPDNSASGHVDAVVLAAGSTVYLPK